MPSDNTLWDDRLQQEIKRFFVEEIQRVLPDDTAVLKKVKEVYELYELGPIGYLQLAKDGRIRSLNLAAAIMLGRSRAELNGRSLFQFVTRRDRDVLFLHLRHLFKEGKPKSCELQIKDPQGRLHWVRLDSLFVQQPTEKLPGTHTSLVDIDEQKEAQAKLAQLAAIVQTSEDAIIRQDPKGIITHWNPAAERIFGYPAAEALGRRFHLIVPPDRMQENHKLMRRARYGDQICAWETVRRAKDGRLIDISLTMSAMHDERGEIAAFATIERDITERVKARDSLNRVHEELKMATGAAHIGTWFADISRRIAKWNKQMYLLLGLDPRPGPEDIESFFNFIHPEDRRGYLESFQTLVKKATSEIKDEFRIIRADGQIRWLAVRGQIIRNEAGDVVHIAGVNFDITEIKQAQEAERMAQMQLAAIVAQLKQKNQELDQFVYAASHDLKAPLRAISNYSDFLQEDLGESLSGEQKLYLAGLKTAACQGQTLIRDLLEYSRIGRAEVKADKIDMPAMINEVKAYLNLSSEIDLTVQKDWPLLETDHLLLMQILKNLVGNAVKFNHRASKRVEIGWRQPDKKGSIEIFVRDNGIGIDPQYQQQVFGIFQRLHTDKEFEGTGIGLAVVKKAAMELGGEVQVESTPGKGSTFYVEIPVKMREESGQISEVKEQKLRS